MNLQIQTNEPRGHTKIKRYLCLILDNQHPLISGIEGNSNPLLFDEENELNFPSYSVEQILTDKFYTTVAYGKYDDTNSRMKDYYDIYLLTIMGEGIDYTIIDDGLKKTMAQRNEFIDSADFDDIIQSLRESEHQRSLWNNYKDVTPFAKNIEFDEVMDHIQDFSDKLIEQRVQNEIDRGFLIDADLEH